MKQKIAGRVAGSLLIATLLLSIGSFVLVWLSRSARVSDVIGFRGFEALLAIVFASVGAIIVTRRPTHPVGWLLLAFGASSAPTSLAQQYAFFAVVSRADPLPGGGVAAWAQEWVAVSQGFLFVLLLLLFPTGRLLSRRWRPVAGLAIVGSALEGLGGALLPGPIATFRTLDNPFGLTGASARVVDVSDTLGNVLFLATILAAAASVILRFRRAEHVERLQLKWIAAASALVAVGSIGFVLTGQEAGAGVYARPVQIFFILAIAGVPVAAAIAILRYRLYDIDRIISRTVGYAIVTIILGGAFALMVVLPPLVLGRSGADIPDYLIAAATLIVAAMFRPVRRPVQDAIDHRFNRSRYDAERTIETFTTRLREQIDIDALLAEVNSVVYRTMQPAHVALWVKPPGSRR